MRNLFQNLTKKIHLFIFILMIIIFNQNVNAQGCSDAGFCTLNPLKPHENSEDVNRTFVKFGGSFGTADNSINAIANYLEYDSKLSSTFGFGVKLTTLAQSGNGISEFGLSDVFLNANIRASDNLIFTFGTKIPLSDGDNQKDGKSLPLDYQASLGTLDLILGFGFFIENFQINAALQQPLSQNNNSFFPKDHPAGSELRNFQSTNNFKRSGDIMFRVSYPVKLTENINFTPGLLPIYHLSNDKFTDKNNVEREIPGSKGLTLNFNSYFDYKLSNGNMLQLSIAFPLKVRDLRPDGLTRSFIANVEYAFSF